MEYISINIGSYKTTIYSSKNNGSPYTDFSSKKEINTLITLKKLRLFGNDSSYSTKDFIKLETEDDYYNLYMYIAFLKRVCLFNNKNHNFTNIVLPSYFTELQKIHFCQLFQKNGFNVTGAVDSLYLSALNLKMKKKVETGRVLIVDLGHSLTSYGLYNFNGEKIEQLKNQSIKIGGKFFDDELYNLIIEKNEKLKKYEDHSQVQQVILKNMESIKINLNESSTVFKKLDLSGNIEIVKIERADYFSAIEKYLNQIEEFLSVEEEYDWCEIIGGNQFNSFVGEVLSRKLKNKNYFLDYRLSSTLGGIYCAVGNLIKVELSLSGEFLVKDNKIYDGDDFIGSLEEDGALESGEQTISKNIKNELMVQVNYNLLGEELLEKLEGREDEYRAYEKEVEKIGELKNKTEHFLIQLPSALQKFNFISEEDYSLIMELEDENVMRDESISYQEEEQWHQTIHHKVQNIIDKINGEYEKWKKPYRDAYSEISQWLKDNKEFSRSKYQIAAMKFKLERELNINFSIEDERHPKDIFKEKFLIDDLIKEHKKELEEKRLKEEKEREEKEELEKKKLEKENAEKEKKEKEE